MEIRVANKGATMTPVFPYLIRRSEDGCRGELLLRLRNGRSAYVVHLSLEQARILAVEMRGLATDHCPLHHLAVRVAEGLQAKISHIVIRRLGEGDDVIGVLRLMTASGLHSIQVDAAAGLATAMHMGIPIFMDGEFSPAETASEGHLHDVHKHEPNLEPPDEKAGLEPGVKTPIPRVFQDLIENLGIPDEGDHPEDRPFPDSDQ